MHVNKPLTRLENLLLTNQKELDLIIKDFDKIYSHFSKELLKRMEYFYLRKDSPSKKEVYDKHAELHDDLETKHRNVSHYYIDLYNDNEDMNLDDVRREIFAEYDIDL